MVRNQDSREDIGEAEVIDGIEREEVIEELLLLVVTAQEGVALVEFLVSSWSERSCFRCLESNFFSMDRRTHALAFPTSVLISPMFWMCLIS